MQQMQKPAKKEVQKNHLDVLELPVDLQQLGLASPLLPPLLSRRLSPLLRPVSVPSLLAASCAQPSHPLAHVDS